MYCIKCLEKAVRIIDDFGRLLGNRFCGYGVPAYCEHPGCNKEINRGFAYACGGQPDSEHGCDRYFCSEHLQTQCWTDDGEICGHIGDCDCECFDVCERCANEKESFPYKPEHPDWVKHLLADKSWAKWRKENPEEVIKLTPSSN